MIYMKIQQRVSRFRKDSWLLNLTTTVRDGNRVEQHAIDMMSAIQPVRS